MRAAILAGILALTFVAGLTIGHDGMPRCPEDAVLIGAGAFDSGRWSAYTCGPAVDDYAP